MDLQYQTPPPAVIPNDQNIQAAAIHRTQAGFPYLSSPWRTMDFLHGLGGPGIGAMQTPQFNPGQNQSQFNPGYGGGYTQGWDPGVYAQSSGGQPQAAGTPFGVNPFLANMFGGNPIQNAMMSLVLGGYNMGATGGPQGGQGGSGGNSGPNTQGWVQPKGASSGSGDDPNRGAPQPAPAPQNSGGGGQQQQGQNGLPPGYIQGSGSGRDFTYAQGSLFDQFQNKLASNPAYATPTGTQYLTGLYNMFNSRNPNAPAGTASTISGLNPNTIGYQAPAPGVPPMWTTQPLNTPYGPNNVGWGR